jgi:hypothetical protein
LKDDESQISISPLANLKRPEAPEERERVLNKFSDEVRGALAAWANLLAAVVEGRSAKLVALKERRRR